MSFRYFLQGYWRVPKVISTQGTFNGYFIHKLLFEVYTGGNFVSLCKEDILRPLCKNNSSQVFYVKKTSGVFYFKESFLSSKVIGILFSGLSGYSIYGTL